MRRNPRLPRTQSAHRRPLASEIPEVAAFLSNPEAKRDEPVQANSEQDAAEEAVRRMVEAAYT
jgi:hypothetical protein